MDHAHANTFTPIFVPKATSLPEVIVVFLLLAILFDQMWAIDLEHY
jgi:hypothetical protein